MMGETVTAKEGGSGKVRPLFADVLGLVLGGVFGYFIPPLMGLKVNPLTSTGFFAFIGSGILTMASNPQERKWIRNYILFTAAMILVLSILLAVGLQVELNLNHFNIANPQLARAVVIAAVGGVIIMLLLLAFALRVRSFVFDLTGKVVFKEIGKTMMPIICLAVLYFRIWESSPRNVEDATTVVWVLAAVLSPMNRLKKMR